MQKLRVLDLFSGIGGFSLGLEWTGGFETAAFCEIEKYPQEVLAKNFPGVPIYDDIKELTAERLVRDGIGRIDVITGGYPCQPFSVAGKQKGEKDDRHIWPFMLEIIAQVRPAWVICENVYGHIALGLDTVLLGLENEGYSSRTFIVPACSVNASHKRDRLWLVSHSYSGCSEIKDKELFTGRQTAPGSSSGKNVADSGSTRGAVGLSGSVERKEGVTRKSLDSSNQQGGGQTGNHWAIEPGMGRVANGIPRRVAKLKALGNAVVPQIPMMIGQAILDYEQNKKV